MIHLRYQCQVSELKAWDIWAVVKFESPVTLIFTPVTNLLFCERIVSTNGMFTHTIKGLHQAYSTIQPWVDILVNKCDNAWDS